MAFPNNPYPGGPISALPRPPQGPDLPGTLHGSAPDLSASLRTPRHRLAYRAVFGTSPLIRNAVPESCIEQAGLVSASCHHQQNLIIGRAPDQKRCDPVPCPGGWSCAGSAPCSAHAAERGARPGSIVPTRDIAAPA